MKMVAKIVFSTVINDAVSHPCIVYLDCKEGVRPSQQGTHLLFSSGVHMGQTMETSVYKLNLENEKVMFHYDILFSY